MRGLLPVCCVALVLGVSCSKAKVDSIKFLNKGIEHYKAREFGAAHTMYRRALELDKTNHRAWFQLGILYLYDIEDKLKEAKQALEKAHELKADDFDYCFHLGRAYLETNNLEGSLALLKEAMKLDPDYPGPYFFSGIALEHQQKFNDAQYAYRKAIEKDPTYIRAFVKLSQLYFKFDKDEAALDVLKEAIRVNEKGEEVAEVYSNLGVYHMRAEHYTKARRYFLEGLKQKTDDKNIAFNLALAYAKEKNRDKAIRYFDKYLNLAGENDPYRRQALSIKGILLKNQDIY